MASRSASGASAARVDLDGNGRRTRNEPLQRTSESGAFRFDGLWPGTYHVRQILARGYATGPGGTSWTESLLSGEAIDAAFANYRPGSVSGMAFEDAEGDGLRRFGLPARIVVLERVLDSGGSVDFEDITLSNRDGRYRFQNLAPGDYRVRILPRGGATTSAPLDGVHDVTLFSGLNQNDRDFAVLSLRARRSL